MSAVTQELLERINELDEKQQEIVLNFVRNLPKSRSEQSAALLEWLGESKKFRRELQEKYGEHHYFNSQALLDELREEESY